jgi:hypothetical protein
MSKIKAGRITPLVDYPTLRKQTNDYNSTFYGPHRCEGCGSYNLIVKRSMQEGPGSWEEHEGENGSGSVYTPHHCTHINLFKRLAGGVLTVLDASLSTNPVQHKAIKDLIKQEFSKVIGRARELEGDRSMESEATLEQVAQ